MSDDNSERNLSRRNALRIAGAAGAASLAGCGGDGDGGSGDGGSGDGGSGDGGSGDGGSGDGGSGDGGSGDGGSGDGGDGQTQTNTLEVAHWWGEGDGLEAIQAVMDAFQEEYPYVDFDENLIAGGAGTNLQSNIRTRIQNGNHPSTWQNWPGKALIPFTDANLLEDIEESVWDQNNMKDAYLEGVKNVAQPAGNYVTVPLNIHRLNNLFYNVSVVEDADVDPSDFNTPSDVVDGLEAVADAGYTGMAHQTNAPWSTVQMFETIFLAQQDAQTYSEVFEDGAVESYRDELGAALDIVRDYSEFYPSDAGSISWTEANSGIINGDAAFIHQGDWAASTYYVNDFAYGEDWNYVPFPGSDSYYSLVIDSFPYPIDNPSPQATTLWCRFVGTTQAQEIFNPGKGAIPPRSDVSTDPFNDFSADQINDFQNSSAQPPSVAHGLAAPPEAASGVNSAISSFISGSSNEEVINQLASAYSGM
ncbi:ABC transporter substrate-binding protein [Haloarcula pelagica]|uniref:ABC transporter substrate-binding protein n=1 Tax=Haloarcula pelagica TaxID=3033389 RepID=UPI0024C3E35C|nr:ABC transporter substrate-binding protein [Halomicroarcula sp. YJ-61-S]